LLWATKNDDCDSEGGQLLLVLELPIDRKECVELAFSKAQ